MTKKRIEVVLDDEVYDFLVSEEEAGQFMAAKEQLGLDADTFIERAFQWSSEHHPDLADQIGTMYGVRSQLDSRVDASDLKGEAKSEFLKRKTMLFVDHVLDNQDSGSVGPGPRYLGNH